MQISDLRQEALAALINERRRNGPFTSLVSFLERAKPHLTFQDVRVLVRAGAFDRLEGADQRPAILWEALRFFNREKTPAQARLFKRTSRPGRKKPEFQGPQSLTPEVRLRHEVETLGFHLSIHPLERYRDIIKGIRRVTARDIPKYVGATVTLVGWPVTGKTVRSRKGDPMKFLSFEDETGLYEAVLFPREYRRFCHMLGGGRAYVLKGKVQEELGAVTVTVGWMGYLDRYGGRRRGASFAG
jgi:error-prone DNA polymerase